MSTLEVLLLLRVLTALLLLLFFGAIGWFLYQDLQLTGRSLKLTDRSAGVLRLISDELAGTAPSFPLRSVTTIGRAASCDLRIDDDYASSHHAVVFLRDGQWWLEDRNSRNGTKLNDMAVNESTILASGDVITIGSTRLGVEL